MNSRSQVGVGLAANLFAISFCACFALARNSNALFYHFDGSYMLVDLRNQLTSSHPIFDFSNDYLQSVGNIQFLQSARLLFFYWPIAFIHDLTIAKIAVYLIIVLMMFLSGYFLARLLSQNECVALTAGWILGVLTTPIVPTPFYYPILSVSPSTVLLVTSPVLGFWAFKAVGRSSFKADLFFFLVLAGIALFLLSSLPLSVSLVGPGLILYTGLALILSRRRSELLRKTAVLSALLLLALCLRWPWYLFGLFAQSAPFLFPNDFTVVYKDPIFVSILFQGSVFGWAGPLLVVVSVSGAILSLRSSQAELRAAAFIVLALVSGLATVGISPVALRHWILPPPIYFEMAGWPLYAVFAAVSLGILTNFAGATVRRARPQGPLGISGNEWKLPIPAMLVTALLARTQPATAIGYPFPPKHPPLVDILRETIAIGPQSRFSGRVATIIPVTNAAPDPWTVQFTTALGLAQAIGNDEMSVGLWYYQIPTLFEYNQLTSPAFHALVKQTLQRPPLAHQRNIIIVSYPNVRVLRLLGVRYVISPRAAERLGELRATEKLADQTWDLWELPAPNLATYSPSSFEVRPDLASSLRFVSDASIDLSKSAVVQEDIDGPLRPAQSVRLSMSNGSLHVVATSPGRSLLVVPLEFSRCIELRDRPTMMNRGNAVRILRVDGNLTGVVFEHSIDAVLTFRTGPLHSPMCRWDDFNEMRAMLR